MLKYLNLDETESISLIVETSPVWETILGIAGYTHGQIRHTFDLDQRWESSTMPNTLRESLKEIQKTNFWYSLILLQDKCSAQTIEEFSNRLLNMDRSEFYGTLLPYKNRKSELIRTELIDRIDQGGNFKEYASYFKGHDYLEGYVLNLERYSQSELVENFINLLTEWFDWISKFDEWTKWNRAIEFEGKQYHSIDKTKPIETIEMITGGVKYFPEPSVWTVKLIPQVSYRPWTLTVRTPETKLFFYPLKEEYFLEPGIPPMELIRGHKALGDEVRLKILYQLTKGPSSLQDLSIQFNVSKTTIHHQLSLLKAAKFLQVDKGIYSINKTQINAFSDRLTKFLGENL